MSLPRRTLDLVPTDRTCCTPCLSRCQKAEGILTPEDLFRLYELTSQDEGLLAWTQQHVTVREVINQGTITAVLALGSVTKGCCFLEDSKCQLGNDGPEHCVNFHSSQAEPEDVLIAFANRSNAALEESVKYRLVVAWLQTHKELQPVVVQVFFLS